MLSLVLSISLISVSAASETTKDKSSILAEALSIGIIDQNTNRNEFITHGEFAKLLWRLNGIPEPGAYCPFADTDAETAKTTASLYEKGVISGYGNGIFGPNDSVTNEMSYDMAARNWNLEPSDPYTCNGYENAGLLSEWVRHPICLNRV
jgi:hypothetical protein